MDSISFRLEDGELQADVFTGEDCIDSLPVSIDDAIALRATLDAAIAAAAPPRTVFHTLEVDGWRVQLSRGTDDGAMVLTVDSTEAASKDHTAEHVPRLYIYVNDVPTYDYTNDRP